MVTFTREEQATISAAKKILASKLKTENAALESPQAAMNYVQLQIGHYEHECFAVVFLDTKHRVKGFKKLFYGTIDGASVYPRGVVKECIKHNAAAVFLVHNHPSGVCEPSQADRMLTERLKEALALIDVRVLDHFIVSNTATLSMVEYGWM